MEKDLIDVLALTLDNLIKDQKLDKYEYFSKEFLPKYTYDAISLEGKNKITYEKIKHLIRYNKIPDYSEREIKEFLNHVACYNQVIKWTEEKSDLTEDDIKDLHNLLERDIYLGGVYRNVNISITGAIHQPPNYVKVYDRMQRTFNDLKEKDYNYFEKGIFIHAHLAKIHPFLDGNGRLGRLVLNFYLIKAGYIPISISLNERDLYFKQIEEFKVNKTLEPLTNFIKEKLELRYEELINKLEI